MRSIRALLCVKAHLCLCFKCDLLKILHCPNGGSAMKPRTRARRTPGSRRAVHGSAASARSWFVLPIVDAVDGTSAPLRVGLPREASSIAA